MKWTEVTNRWTEVRSSLYLLLTSGHGVGDIEVLVTLCSGDKQM